MGEKRAAVTAVAAVLGGAVLLVVLVTWAASIGPSGVLTGEGPQAVRTTTTETAEPGQVESRLRVEEQDRLEERHRGDRPLLRAIAIVLEVLLAAVVAWLLLRWGRRAHEAWRDRRRDPGDPEHVEFDVLEVPQARLVEEIGRDATQQREALLGGSPRNGIVACWHRFEVQAAAAGIAPHVWETSSEFTMRFLDLAGADSSSVVRLGALYREARFSRHELGEDARAVAVEALDAVHRGLLRRTP